MHLHHSFHQQPSGSGSGSGSCNHARRVYVQGRPGGSVAHNVTHSACHPLAEVVHAHAKHV
eukprot:scaffold225721_cov19-Tisochrysis_lutea.AAC.1